LVFQKDSIGKQECVEYVDSDYVGNLDKRRSTTGYVFTLYQAPMSWHSIVLSTVALFATELEYMPMTEAMKEVIWLQGLLDDLGIDQDLLKINYDSMSAIYLAMNQVHHARTKHIDVMFHFVREILDEGHIELQKVHRKENLVDMLTKLVLGVKFTYCKELLHILPVA